MQSSLSAAVTAAATAAAAASDTPPRPSSWTLVGLAMATIAMAALMATVTATSHGGMDIHRSGAAILLDPAYRMVSSSWLRASSQQRTHSISISISTGRRLPADEDLENIEEEGQPVSGFEAEEETEEEEEEEQHEESSEQAGITEETEDSLTPNASSVAEEGTTPEETEEENLQEHEEANEHEEAIEEIEIEAETEEGEGQQEEEQEQEEQTGNASDETNPSSEYQAVDDDPIQMQDEEIVEHVEEELAKQEKVARTAGGFGLLFAIGAMIFTAHQMSENPDGIYASVCRLAITICGVVIKIICMPCRKLMGAGSPHYGHGHMPISTVDYNYRGNDAAFEMT